MKKSIILLFGFLLFAQSNIFAMDCSATDDKDTTAHGESKHKDMEMAKKDSNDTASVKAKNIGNTVCPVTGEKINEKYKSSYEYKDTTYNFCCAGCVDEFKKDPGKYIKIIGEELQKKWDLMNLKVKDPVCNKEINSQEADATSVYNGKTYYFDSNECKAKFDKEPGKYIKD
ncbi:MAG: YHS domain-containing protein [bacterium]|nr:YHS domain-containing protein [bacterium]